MAVNEDGKYTKLTDETIKLLEQAFAMDCSVVEACLFANISTPTYYAWIKNNPALDKRFSELRATPFLKARKTIVKNLDNPQYAFEYMKRKKKDEFSERSEVDVAVSKSFNKVLDEIEHEETINGQKVEDK